MSPYTTSDTDPEDAFTERAQYFGLDQGTLGPVSLLSFGTRAPLQDHWTDDRNRDTAATSSRAQAEGNVDHSTIGGIPVPTALSEASTHHSVHQPPRDSPHSIYSAQSGTINDDQHPAYHTADDTSMSDVHGTLNAAATEEGITDVTSDPVLAAAAHIGRYILPRPSGSDWRGPTPQSWLDPSLSLAPRSLAPRQTPKFTHEPKHILPKKSGSHTNDNTFSASQLGPISLEGSRKHVLRPYKGEPSRPTYRSRSVTTQSQTKPRRGRRSTRSSLADSGTGNTAVAPQSSSSNSIHDTAMAPEDIDLLRSFTNRASPSNQIASQPTRSAEAGTPFDAATLAPISGLSPEDSARLRELTNRDIGKFDPLRDGETAQSIDQSNHDAPTLTPEMIEAMSVAELNRAWKARLSASDAN